MNILIEFAAFSRYFIGKYVCRAYAYKMADKQRDKDYLVKI